MFFLNHLWGTSTAGIVVSGTRNRSWLL
jgi:hypothetical protein